jgi:hypothetical protein
MLQGKRMLSLEGKGKKARKNKNKKTAQGSS